MKKLFLFAIIIVAVLGCEQEKENKEPTTSQVQTIPDPVLDFAKQYNAIVGWDTLNIFTSVQYEDLIAGKNILLNKKVMTFNDIYKEGEKVFISFSTIYPTIHFELECNHKQKNQLLEMVDRGYYMGLIAILYISEIRKVQHIIDVENDGDIIDLNFVVGRSFVFKGKIIQLFNKGGVNGN